MRDTRALGGGPYHFFCRSSRSAAASSICSAKSFFSLAFLVLERLEPLGLGHIHTPVTGFPVVQRGFRDPVLARQIGRLGPSLVILQHRNDLLFRKPGSLHLSVLCQAGL